MEKKLKAGVLGAGHLGKIHLRLLFQSEKYDLVGFYDENQTVRDTVAKENGFKAFDSATELMLSLIHI